MNSYPVQELVRLVVQFIAPLQGNAPVDPTDVTVTLTPPGDTEPQVTVDFESGGGIVRDGPGVYHYDFVPGLMGQWLYRWQGTGAVIASSGNGFFRGV